MFTLSGDLAIWTLYDSADNDTYARGFMSMNERMQVIFHDVGIEERLACGLLLDKELFPSMPTRGKSWLIRVVRRGAGRQKRKQQHLGYQNH